MPARSGLGCSAVGAGSGVTAESTRGHKERAWVAVREAQGSRFLRLRVHSARVAPALLVHLAQDSAGAALPAAAHVTVSWHRALSTSLRCPQRGCANPPLPRVCGGISLGADHWAGVRTAELGNTILKAGALQMDTRSWQLQEGRPGYLEAGAGSTGPWGQQPSLPPVPLDSGSGQSKDVEVSNKVTLCSAALT